VEALVLWLLKEAERQPLRLDLEDLHWADPSTLKFLGLPIDQVPRTRLLVLLTCRPEFRPPWPAWAHLTQLMLRRLAPKQAEVMVQKMTGGKGLPAEVLHQRDESSPMKCGRPSHPAESCLNPSEGDQPAGEPPRIPRYSPYYVHHCRSGSEKTTSVFPWRVPLPRDLSVSRAPSSPLGIATYCRPPIL
jgi:hypothetical protein